MRSLRGWAGSITTPKYRQWHEGPGGVVLPLKRGARRRPRIPRYFRLVSLHRRTD